VASPEGKEARVRKPYKKPRQVTIRETQDGDSEGPTQLGVGETVDKTKPSFVHRKDNSEWGKSMEKKLGDMEKRNAFGSQANVPLCQSPPSLKSVSDSSEDEDNRPIHETITKKGNVTPPTIRPMSYREACETAEFGEVQRWSSDDGDEIPITDLAKALKDNVDTIPEGQSAVGEGIARDFGKELGMFKGKVIQVETIRTRHIYHVVYEDGDSEDFDLDEYRYAYELRQALDKGLEYEPPNETLEPLETESPQPKKRKRQPRAKKTNGEAPLQRARGVKLKKKMDQVTYTMDAAMNEFGADSEFGKALRDMPDAERIVAVAKLNKGATNGIKGAVKAKVLSSKYSSICMEKLKDHLVAMRVEEKDMFRKSAPVHSGRTMNSAGVSIGDWVQVDADRTPGWNSEGGIAIVTASSQNKAEVK
jgi:hypothetical protein